MIVPEPTQTRVGMPMEEFIRLYDREGPFELIDGERRPLVPNLSEHGEIIIFLLRLLFRLESAAQIVFYTEQPFVLAESSEWVKGSRVPDIMVYAAARMAAYKQQVQDWRDKPFALVPDLVVEVVSKHDSYSEVEEKVALYLADGVRVVWVIDPRSRGVMVHLAGSNLRTRLGADDTLDGGDVIAGFSIRVGELMEG